MGLQKGKNEFQRNFGESLSQYEETKNKTKCNSRRTKQERRGWIEKLGVRILHGRLANLLEVRNPRKLWMNIQRKVPAGRWRMGRGLGRLAMFLSL